MISYNKATFEGYYFVEIESLIFQSTVSLFAVVSVRFKISYQSSVCIKTLITAQVFTRHCDFYAGYLSAFHSLLPGLSSTVQSIRIFKYKFLLSFLIFRTKNILRGFMESPGIMCQLKIRKRLQFCRHRLSLRKSLLTSWEHWTLKLL